jgi:hypothetical protein
MPNWCTNWAEIEGPIEKIQALHEAGKDEQFLEHMAPLGNSEWRRDECVDEWGTKWDIDIGKMDFSNTDDGRAVLKGFFESAWSPPDTAFTKFLIDNKDVNIDLMYFEPAMDFIGTLEHGTFTISEVGEKFFLNTRVGKKLDETFCVIDMLEYEMTCVLEDFDPSVLDNPEKNDE